MTKTIATRFAANITDREQIVKDAIREAKGMRIPFESKALVAFFLADFCAAYGCEPKAKERGEGFTWPTRIVDGKAVRTRAGDTAKNACEELVKLMLGKPAKQKDEVEIPAELLAAAAKLAKLAAQYEGARSLASKALAQAFTAE